MTYLRSTDTDVSGAQVGWCVEGVALTVYGCPCASLSQQSRSSLYQRF